MSGVGSPDGVARTVPAASSGHPAELLVTLPAEAVSIGVVRRRLREWMDGWDWPDEPVDEVVMAVNEAVANVVDHAYRDEVERGSVHVYAWITTDGAGRRVVVSITDRGRWRPAPHDPGHRGRGLLMMSSCMASLHIEHSSGGTAVTMSSVPVPALPQVE